VVTGLSDPWLKAFGVDFPGAGFVITILAFIGLGFMATHVIGRRLLDHFELFMLRIPVAGSIYFGAKQVLQTIQGMGSGPKPKRAAVLECLVPGGYLFGYATGHFTEAGSGREMITVLVPTAPNPTTGQLIAVSRRKGPGLRPEHGGGNQNARLGRLAHPAAAPLCPSRSSGGKITNVRLNI